MIESATSKANKANRAESSWIEYTAALWALIFALLHIVWAFGWYVGLDAESASRAFERGWFLAFDLIAAGLSVLAAAVALALIQHWGRRLPRLLIGAMAWGCAVILTLRGAAGVIKAVYLATAGNSIELVLSFWDLWFCLGAMLFAAIVLRFHRASV